MIVLSVAVAAASALGFSAQMTPQYEAKAKVFVGPRSVQRDDAAGAIQEITFSREFVASYAEILKSRPLAEKVVEKTKAPTTAVRLAERSKTRIIPDTRLIELSVTDPSATRAQLYANEMVKTFVEDPDGQFAGGSGRSASVFEPALLPIDPVSPKPLQNGLIGALLGAFLGVGLAFLLERLDTAVRGAHDVERALAPLPVIAQIPLKAGRKRFLFNEADPDSPQAEALRILRTNVQFFSVDQPIQTVLVTSPFAAEGKTTVAANLASSIAAVGAKVLLVETDLRKPVLHEILELHPSGGLSNVLAGQFELAEAVEKSRVPNLFVLSAGTTPPNPSELLGSEKMVRVIQELRTMADIVIFDTTPCLPVTDAAVLAPHTDGVVLVVRAGRTPLDKAAEAVRNFARHDVRMLGVVINGVEHDSEDANLYGYRYYRRTRAGRGRRHKAEQEKMDREFLFAPKGPSSRPAPQKEFTHSQNGSREGDADETAFDDQADSWSGPEPIVASSDSGWEGDEMAADESADASAANGSGDPDRRRKARKATK